NNIAEIAEKNGGIYTRESHLRHIEKKQKYIPSDEIDGYVDAHETRLETLEKAGIVARTDRGWQVPDDMPAQAKALAEKMKEGQKSRKFTRLQVLSDTSIKRQMKAEADTWLDGELVRRSRRGAQVVRYDRTTEAALQFRQQWLVEHNYARQDAGGAQYAKGFRRQLADKEVSRAMREAYGNRYDPAPRYGTVEGKLKGTHKLISGRYAAIERGGRVTAVKVSRTPDMAVGQQVAAQVGKAAKAALQAIRGRGIGD